MDIFSVRKTVLRELTPEEIMIVGGGSNGVTTPGVGACSVQSCGGAECTTAGGGTGGGGTGGSNQTQSTTPACSKLGGY